MTEKTQSGKLLALNPSEDAEFQKKVQQVKKRQKAVRVAIVYEKVLTPGVIYVGHLPQSLAEPQLRSYFSQFGDVQRLRLSRSKKTGRSKGYAFVEFECDEVAKIVAETMDNYLMGERLIKCSVMPPEKVHEKLFVGSQKIFKKPKRPAVARYNKAHGPEEMKKLSGKLLSKESKLRKRLAEKGIDYDFPGFAAQVKKAPSDADTSACSEDATPVCTPSVLERRRSIKVKDDDVDDEIVLKIPPKNSDDFEDSEDTEEEEEEEGSEEEEEGSEEEQSDDED
ncbi:MKI67 FHA domain-interacting nucleolar phosphoprotein isoform X1 [Hemibagrus wyckioides]|uniref:MKI67 FHA domain-interacting nucleolar phosphoprotein isoform X1 n=1 Tax=Hemibagrus wyckioides TaxID=337641 RepID=UPI00266D2975|nr:MKI67 FHA domain-interacting nucleolar phosphoprotein isoform X1 [Hemibagrus wyckioides]